jgi:dimethylamine/trimethylamine dehydrogenase
VLDLIGAARPSIADPFLPQKIDEGREQDIRECIGCNICISSWHDSVPVRCTQNPTVGEEWRRSWHPERIEPAASDASVLIIGAGPAGLECALALGRRGYEVTVAEAADEIGGRLRFETRLPGLAGWGRVLDWRRGQLERLANVNVYRGNRLSADEILELGNTHVVIATGSRWARLLYSALELPVGRLEGPNVYTPDDVAEGAKIQGPVVVYDFDNYYMGSVLAEHLARSGQQVSYVTPAGHASAWAIMSNEQPQIHRALFAAGIALHTLSRVTHFESGELTLVNQFTNAERRLACQSLLIVGARFANDFLYAALTGREEELKRAGISSVTRIGDAAAPGALVHAVYSGHRYARELDTAAARLAYRRDAPLSRASESAATGAAAPGFA